MSYERKHNLANLEDNRDGDNTNNSRNYGVEGPTRRKSIVTVRNRQAKNFMASLLLSQGVPMILSGDEVLRTQRGNNNAYCQDNQISWFDWRFDKFRGRDVFESHGTFDFRSYDGSGLRPAAWIIICNGNCHGSDGVPRRQTT